MTQILLMCRFALALSVSFKDACRVCGMHSQQPHTSCRLSQTITVHAFCMCNNLVSHVPNDLIIVKPHVIIVGNKAGQIPKLQLVCQHFLPLGIIALPVKSGENDQQQSIIPQTSPQHSLQIKTLLLYTDNTFNYSFARNQTCEMYHFCLLLCMKPCSI